MTSESKPSSKHVQRTYFEENPEQPSRYIHRSEPAEVVVEDDRTGMRLETFQRAFKDNLYYLQGVNENLATLYDYYMALSYTMRDRLMHRWIKTIETYAREGVKGVYYLSAEFLMGRQLGKNLLNAGCWRTAHRCLKEAGLNLYDIMEQEPEPGLGNGGLGRLAACFLDSLATLQIPAMGHGIRYEFGIFKQTIENGWQVEQPDEWLLLENPWEICRPQHTVEVKFGGYTQNYTDEKGVARLRWVPDQTVLGTPYDTLVPGYDTNTVNTLRLWSARASKNFDFQLFNAGDYFQAVADKTRSENISKVLYPNDNAPEGRKLRLKQQYFFVSCALQDILRVHLKANDSLDNLHERAAIQLNDTHPAVAVAELMRLLIDEHQVSWSQSWEITQKTFGYTNHTLLTEALEKWPVELFGSVLPRHLQLIYEINQNFLEVVRKRFPNDDKRLQRMSLIEEGEQKQVRMANLATVGSHAVNGVAKLHSQLVRDELLRDFYELWPEKFSNKTNGVTPRRWLMISNLKLSFLITEKIGKGWITDLDQLKQLEQYVDDEAFRQTWRIFKYNSKGDLAEYIDQTLGIKVNPDSLFDVQVKRIHEYKRQLLMALYIVTLYNRIKANPQQDLQPRTFIFAGKAAPGYFMAKLIIKFINSVGEVVNKDPEVADRIKVVFLPNFSVSLGQRVYPAADLSEQISTAGKEASGTGNMKFAMNGALTIGTLDGANIEIRDAVGQENFFLFGMSVEQIRELKHKGYSPRSYYENDGELRGVIDSIASGRFSHGDNQLFNPLVEHLLTRDDYFLCADYRSYVDCQEQVSRAFREEEEWTRKSIINTARMGYFSSDRTIREYADEIWKAKPVPVELGEYNQEEAVIKLKSEDEVENSEPK